MSTKHTPTPWKTGGERTNWVDGPDGQLILGCSPINVGVDEAIANTNLVVLAVNSHHDLVEALDRIESWLVCAGITTAEDVMQSVPEMLETIQSALFKAKGE